MTGKVQKIRNEVVRLMNELIQEKEKGFGSDVDDACILELQNVLTYIDSLQKEEPVSIWHDMSEEVENGKNIIIIDPKGFYSAVLRKGGSQLRNHNKERYVKWAYIDDIINVTNREEPVSEQDLSNVERTVKNWKDAQGDDLPEYDREVIVLIKYNTQRNIHDEEYPTYRVGFGHRPNPNGWDGKSVTTGKVEHYTPKLYDKGGWNIPNIVYWLDAELPKEIEL